MAVATTIAVGVYMGVMKPILAKLTTLLGDEYKKLKGVRKQLSLLKDELTTMNAFLEKLELMDDEIDPLANDWRSHVREMAFDIEDCIDDYMHKLGSEDLNEGFVKKTIHCLKTLRDRHRIANQISKLNARVLEASDRRKRYKLDDCTPSDEGMRCKRHICSSSASSSIDPRLSALYNEASSLVGLENPKEELTNMVMDERQKLRVVSIVGHGGLGKTTLASMVCHEVAGQFDCKAFVSVSQKPDINRLLNGVLSQLNLSPPSHARELTDLIDYIREYLREKRYLIVVDDLWGVPAWNIIKCVFPETGKQSRVIVTTRHLDVAISCSSDNGGVHNMKPLSDQDSRKLFYNRIFGSDDGCPPQFINVSREILKKCSGLPLAIITVAGILACQPTRIKEEWEHIQDCLATQAAANSTLKDMMHILDLSYKFLPRHLEACFLYLGTYPEDHEIEKDDLVRQWVAEGFVSGPIRRSAWDVAESYLNELVNRSMIQLAYNYSNNNEPYYKVHDMMLDLILRRCRENNFIRLVHDPQSMAAAEVQVKVRRLTVQTTDDVIIGKHLSQVRSLSLFRANRVTPFSELRFLRVLFLLEFPLYGQRFDLTCVSQLLQLRYLKVHAQLNNGPECLVVLPSQMRSMRHLETLEIQRHAVVSIPPDIISLPCLSNLIVEGRILMMLPDGIDKVKSLCILRCFRLPADSTATIEGLGELTNLADLDLNCQVDGPTGGGCIPMTTAWMAAWSSSLLKLSNLRKLRVNSYPSSCCADTMSSWVSPPFPFLEVLDVGGWTFSRVPRWIGGLHKVHTLRFGVKKLFNLSWDDVGIMGMLPSLILLDLRVEGDVPAGGIVIDGSRGFKLLQKFYLQIKSTSHLAFEAGAMPNLRELMLTVDPEECDNRAAAPVGLEHLTSLKRIILLGATDENLTSLSQEVEARFDASSAMFRQVVQGLPSQPSFEGQSYSIVYRPWGEDRRTTS